MKDTSARGQDTGHKFLMSARRLRLCCGLWWFDGRGTAVDRVIRFAVIVVPARKGHDLIAEAPRTYQVVPELLAADEHERGQV